MSHRHISIGLFSINLVFLVAGELSAQQRTLAAKDVTGTYASRTGHLFAPDRDGCWLEVAPVATDSVRLQLRCQNPAPGHHLGVMDVRRRFDTGKVVYETDEFVGHCRIIIRFARDSAVVTHDASGANRDSACGFGAYVDVSGVYRRLTAQRPRFELAPIERSSPPSRQ